MTEPLANTDLHATVADGELAGGPQPTSNVAAQLRARVVREARRETWFVVNEGDDDVATVPLSLTGELSLRRVEVNGEAAEFTADTHEVLVRPLRPLRSGAGTIVVLHFR